MVVLLIKRKERLYWYEDHCCLCISIISNFYFVVSCYWISYHTGCILGEIRTCFSIIFCLSYELFIIINMDKHFMPSLPYRIQNSLILRLSLPYSAAAFPFLCMDVSLRLVGYVWPHTIIYQDPVLSKFLALLIFLFIGILEFSRDSSKAWLKKVYSLFIFFTESFAIKVLDLLGGFFVWCFVILRGYFL